MTATPAGALPTLAVAADWDIFTRPADSPSNTRSEWCHLLDAHHTTDAYGHTHIITLINWHGCPHLGMAWHPTYNTPQIRHHTPTPPPTIATPAGDQYLLPI